MKRVGDELCDFGKVAYLSEPHSPLQNDRNNLSSLILIRLRNTAHEFVSTRIYAWLKVSIQ